MRRKIGYVVLLTALLVSSGAFAQNTSSLADPRFMRAVPAIAATLIDSLSKALNIQFDININAADTSLLRFYIDSSKNHQFAPEHNGKVVIVGQTRNVSRLNLDTIARMVSEEPIGKDTTLKIGFVRFKGMLMRNEGWRALYSQHEVFRDTILPASKKPADEPSSTWSSTIEPILVAVGAAVVIALFFIIRS